jgi:hypothetical protein
MTYHTKVCFQMLVYTSDLVAQKDAGKQYK